jgi:hypothetical protein
MPLRRKVSDNCVSTVELSSVSTILRIPLKFLLRELILGLVTTNVGIVFIEITTFRRLRQPFVLEALITSHEARTLSISLTQASTQHTTSIARRPLSYCAAIVLPYMVQQH